jgi:hypothetical protein
MKNDPSSIRGDVIRVISLCLLTVVSFVALAIVPSLRTTVPLEFDYPATELPMIQVFKVYSSTNPIQAVTSWPLYATLYPTNLTMLGTNASGLVTNRFTLPIDATQRYFVMTASNWFGEGGFSVVAGTPPPPRSDVPLRVGP